MSYAQIVKGLSKPKSEPKLSVKAPEFVPLAVSASTKPPASNEGKTTAENATKLAENKDKSDGANKTKKRKPQLRTLKIEDLIVNRISSGNLKKKRQGQSQAVQLNQRKTQAPTKPTLESADFPSLISNKQSTSDTTIKHIAETTAPIPTPAPAPPVDSSSPTAVAPPQEPTMSQDRDQFVVPTSSKVITRHKRKKLSTLKKRVLEERLAQWQAKHPSHVGSNALQNHSNTVILRHYCQPDELEDDDEYDEIVENLRDMARTIQVDLKRWYLSAEATFCGFDTPLHAETIASCWDGMVIQGVALQCAVLPGLSPEDDEGAWKAWCQLQVTEADTTQTMPELDKDTTACVVLENALTLDDLADEECLEETLTDLRKLASEHGPVKEFSVQDKNIIIFYEGGLAMVRDAATALSKVVLAGQQLHATVQMPKRDGTKTVVALQNILTDEELDDPDCLQECLDDISEIVARFGSIDNVTLSSEEKNTVLVHYISLNDSVETTLQGLGAISLGGISIHAALVQVDGSSTTVLLDPSAIAHSEASQVDKIEPIMSGDKIIPERFAACKRVPKLANAGQPRGYAKLVPDERVLALLKTILAELMRLQRRALEEKNTKAKRRLVMGLREVHRGLRANKMKMVVMANNLDEYGVLDAKLQEILDVAKEREIPVFFEFSKRALGKAIGKNLKMAVVGIQNVDGANQEYKKLVPFAPTL